MRELEEEGIVVRRRKKKEKFDIKDVDMNQYLIGQEENLKKKLMNRTMKRKKFSKKLRELKTTIMKNSNPSKN